MSGFFSLRKLPYLVITVNDPAGPSWLAKNQYFCWIFEPYTNQYSNLYNITISSNPLRKWEYNKGFFYAFSAVSFLVLGRGSLCSSPEAHPYIRHWMQMHIPINCRSQYLHAQTTHGISMRWFSDTCRREYLSTSLTRRQELKYWRQLWKM